MKLPKIAKSRLTNALSHFKILFLKNNIIVPEVSPTIPADAKTIGEKLYQCTVKMSGKQKFVSDEEFILSHESDDESLFHEVEDDSLKDEDYEPEEEKRSVDYIPLRTKVKVLRIVKEHPTWSLRSLRRKGCSRLKRKSEIKRWEKHIKAGGTKFDKYSIIDSWTYDRCEKARKNGESVNINLNLF